MTTPSLTARRALLAAAALLLLPACRAEQRPPAERSAERSAAGDSALAYAAPVRARVAFSPDSWTPPADSEIPNDSLGAAIRRGRALLVHTTDSLPRYAPGRITCTSCHLNGGRSAEGLSLAGSYARFPRYLERTGAVINLVDRVNYCFTRSLAGRKLPGESREMQDILAYLAFLSRGVPVGAETARTDRLVKMPGLDGDSARGAEVYRTSCQLCHGADGQGGPAIPALWGPKSYSVGASMARQERAASFIWHNMPYGQPKSLTHQQAFDVARFVNAHPRPDSPGKENDWPLGGTPKDTPYDTKSGHRAFRPPPLLPRANPTDAIVLPPRRAPIDEGHGNGRSGRG